MGNEWYGEADPIENADQEVLKAMRPLIDNDKPLVIPEGAGEVVPAHPAAPVFADMNPSSFVDITCKLRPAEVTKGISHSGEWSNDEDPFLLHDEYDRLFKAIVGGGWANHSGGNVEAPTGYFALIHIKPNEVQEMHDAFEDEVGELVGLANGIRDLAGYYLTREDNNGLIWVVAYRRWTDALDAFGKYEADFAEWDDEEGPN